ncbi:MAG: SufD family Fe-S cluster assembly protein [Alphaproteobacteria bacterium]|nr:SufD family Fe-S cluster assembly protein [Alphaproteobacteria bacterium]
MVFKNYDIKADQHFALRQAASSDTHITITLGKNATADVKLAAETHAAQKINLQVDVVHTGDNSKSKIELAGVARDDSQINFQSSLKAATKIKNAEAKQDLRIMLLSPTAHGTAHPTQHITTPGIAASHSAAVYGANPEHLFALALLGIDSASAKNLLSSALLKV